MTFFLNSPRPEEGEGEAQASPSSYSAKSRPLFKQDDSVADTLSGQHMSLSAYISKHLQEQEAEPSPTPETKKAPQFRVQQSNPADPALHPTAAVGQYLNSLDVEMASGLEQYLPSPLFRLRITKKRLDGEVSELRMRLNKYERLPNPSPAMQTQMEAMRHKLTILEQYQRQVNQELNATLVMGQAFATLSTQGQGVQHWIAGCLARLKQILMSLAYGQIYLKLQTNTNEISYLKELYAERSQDRGSTEVELSAIINRFEQVVQQAESDAQKIKPGSFPSGLWQDVKRLVK